MRLVQKRNELTLDEQATNINEHLMQHQVTFMRRSNFKLDLFQNSDTFTHYIGKKIRLFAKQLGNYCTV